MKKILVTGAAGFIGFHLAKRLCDLGKDVWGVDNLSDYYDVSLKEGRLACLEQYENFHFVKANLADSGAIEQLFKDFKPDAVANLAAQPGVRYSLENPQAYIESNITGFVNILESCRAHSIQHLVFASSSSVYGANTKVPFAVDHNVDHPISLYAATKKSNELIAHSYAHLFQIPCTGLRFFTVYGPWGRPDMAVFKFTKALFEGQTLDVYNEGDMKRDFTYIDDIVEGVARVLGMPATPDSGWSGDVPNPDTSYAPYRIYNIGNHQCVKLMDMIQYLEEATGIIAKLNMLPMQQGDVYETYADVQALEDAVGFAPNTPLKTGLESFVAWYKEYYGISDEGQEAKSKAS